jgi:hypothetical protein
VTYRLTLCLLAGALTGCAGPTPALIGSLNPDVTQATISQTICKAGWAKSVRPPASYTSKLKRQQLPAGARMADWSEDHLMPIELGGAPRDPANLRPIPVAKAKADDKWENTLHREVCAGSMTLATARVKMSEIKRGEG